MLNLVVTNTSLVSPCQSWAAHISVKSHVDILPTGQCKPLKQSPSATCYRLSRRLLPIRQNQRSGTRLVRMSVSYSSSGAFLLGGLSDHSSMDYGGNQNYQDIAYGGGVI